MTGRVLLNRAASILIVVALLTTPFAGLLLFAGTSEGQELQIYNGGPISIGSAYEYSYWNITGNVVMTGDLTIGAGGVVTVDRGSITFSQSLGHVYTLIIEDGGKLILKNSTLTTRLNNLQDFPSLGVIARNGGVLEAYDSIIKFPGHMVIDDSTLTLWRSTITGHDSSLIGAYCNETYFPADSFNDAPVLLFMSATVNLYDSRLEKIYERGYDGLDHNGMYDHNYLFAADGHSLDGNRSDVTYLLNRMPSGIGDGDNTGQPLENLTVDDLKFYEIAGGETMLLSGFDTGGLVFNATDPAIGQLVLHVEYYTDPEYTGFAHLQYQVGGGSAWNDAIILAGTPNNPVTGKPDQGSLAFTLPDLSTQNLYNLNLRFINPDSDDNVYINKIWVSVEMVLDTYRQVTLAGTTALTSVNSYIGVDFSDSSDLHNAMVLMDGSIAYLYGISVDETQQASESNNRPPGAFVTVEKTFEAVVSSVENNDTTAHQSLYNATEIDLDYYVVAMGQKLSLNEFNTMGLVGPISSATLNFRYLTSNDYNGASYVQWSSQDVNLGNTNIPIGLQPHSPINTTFELHRHGVNTVEDVRGITIEAANDATFSTNYLYVDKIWIDVTLSPTVYMYRWANITAFDSQGNPVSGAMVDATVEIPSEIPAYYHTPSGVQYVPPTEVLRYLGTDGNSFNKTGNGGKVTIPYLSEIINSSDLNPFVVDAYNLTVIWVDGGDPFYNNVSVGHRQEDVNDYPEGGYSWEQYPNLSKAGMYCEVQVSLTNLIFLPDLYISSADIDFSPGTVTALTEVNVAVTVHNDLGNAPAFNVLVEIYAGNRATDGQLIGQAVISVGAYDVNITSFKWVADQIGEYPIYVYINSNMNVRESDYTNNVAYKNFKVTIDIDEDSDFVIGGTSPYQDLTFRTPLSIATNVVIMDGGRLTFDGTTFIMQQSGGLNVVVQDDGELRLLNGASMTSTGSVDLSLFDNARLEILNSAILAGVKVIPYSNSQIDIRDSQLNSELATPESSSMSLVAYNATFTRVSLGDAATAELTNVNIPILIVQGSATVQHYRWMQITVVDGRGTLLPDATVAIRPVAGAGTTASADTGSDGTITFRVLSETISASGARSVGSYFVDVAYTYDGQTYHGLENDVIRMPFYSPGTLAPVVVTPTDNNENERFLILEGLLLPQDPADLKVSNLQFSPTGPVNVKDHVTVSVVVTNNGELASPETIARFYLGDRTSGTVFFTATVPSIPAGETTTVSATWSASVTSSQRDQERTITVSVDRVGDENDNDNYVEGTIRVLDGRPDVALFSNIEVTKSGNTVTGSAIGETITIKAWANVGSGSPSAMAVKFIFYAQNETTQYPIGELTKDVLVSQTVELTLDWTINVPVGNYVIVVEANYDGVIDESDTTNNIASTAFEAEAPNPLVTIYSLGAQAYEPGKNVFVQGIVTNENTGAPIAGAIVSIAIYRDGIMVNNAPFTATTGSDGIFATSVFIPEGTDGQYQVHATATIGDKSYTGTGLMTVKAVGEDGAPWWLYVIILAIVTAVIVGFSAYLYRYGLGRMVECGECGALIPESSKRCPKCGVEFETGTAKCSKCGAWIAANSTSCPECGAKFITEATEEEEDAYLKNMREQYEAFVDTYREEAKKVLEKKYSDAKFPDWWKKQPTYVSFESWLSQEEDKRKIGGMACPTCGILNPRGSTICHKCGSLLEPNKVASPAAPLAAPGAEEKKPEEKPKLRRIVRRPVEKKPAAPADVTPAPAPEAAPEATKEEAKATEEKKPEDDKPSA